MSERTLTVDFKQVEALRDKLGALTTKAIPYAVRNTLNQCAFEGRKAWAHQLDKSMVLRNKYTTNSLRVKKVAGGINIPTMQSHVGSPLDYLEQQEFGGQKTARGHGVPMPTKFAAGQVGGEKRMRGVQRKNYLRTIKLAAKPHLGNQKQQNAIAIRLAAKTGGVVYLDLGRRKGLFKVSGSKRARKKVRMLWSFSEKSQHVKPRPTLEPAVKVVQIMGSKIMTAALEEQFDLFDLYKGGQGPVRRIGGRV